jgi:hypothetical protein
MSGANMFRKRANVCRNQAARAKAAGLAEKGRADADLQRFFML